MEIVIKFAILDSGDSLKNNIVELCDNLEDAKAWVLKKYPPTNLIGFEKDLRSQYDWTRYYQIVEVKDWNTDISANGLILRSNLRILKENFGTSCSD